MGDPVHESVPLSPDHRNDVIEPDRNLEEQIIEDKESARWKPLEDTFLPLWSYGIVTRDACRQDTSELQCQEKKDHVSLVTRKQNKRHRKCGLCDDLSNVYKEDFISAKVKMASWDLSFLDQDDDTPYWWAKNLYSDSVGQFNLLTCTWSLC